MIPCFGFGDGNILFSVSITVVNFILVRRLRSREILCLASTHDQEVFSFNEDESYCNGFEEVLRRYRELVPRLRLAGFRATYNSLYFTSKFYFY